MADLDALQTFAIAVRTGSFARAARELGVTPAMVGRRIQGLETRYGARLIERTTRSQRLTEAGEAFLLRAEAVLAAAADLDESMRTSPGDLAGRVRMTAATTLGAARLAEVVAHFCEANPAVTVEMTLENRRADLVAEGFDFAVRIGELQSSTMIGRQVGTYRFAVIAAPDHVERHGLPQTPADLARARCLLNLNISPRNRWPLFRDGQREIAEVAGGLQIDNDQAQRVAALQGGGIAYLPIDLVRDDIAAGRLVRLLPGWETMTMPITLVYPSRRVTRRVSALMDAISTGLRETHATPAKSV